MAPADVSKAVTTGRMRKKAPRRAESMGCLGLSREQTHRALSSPHPCHCLFPAALYPKGGGGLVKNPFVVPN